MAAILVVKFRSRLVVKSDFSAIGRSKHTPKICQLSGSQKTVLSGNDWSGADASGTEMKDIRVNISMANQGRGEERWDIRTSILLCRTGLHGTQVRWSAQNGR
jgi:hypothetical protein